VNPSGSVTFISDVWSGQVSDKKLTVETGLLEKFVPGDAVMADRGFLVQNEFSFRQVSLIVHLHMGRNSFQLKMWKRAYICPGYVLTLKGSVDD